MNKNMYGNIDWTKVFQLYKAEKGVSPLFQRCVSMENRLRDIANLVS